MRDRYYLKKDSKGSYDPQVGTAAQEEADTAQKSEQFSEGYFNQYIAPLLGQEGQEAADANNRENQLFSENMADMQRADQRYQQYGIPAEDNYYNMVKNYSSDDYQNQQATAALGDNLTAQGVQSANLDRTLQSSDIDPTSPAAVAAKADMAVSNAAANAGAETHARDAAKAMGMQLTSDAANFGRGGSSAVLNFGSAAQGNNSAGMGMNTQALGAAEGGAGVVQNGLNIANSAYGNNLSAYSSLDKESMATNAQNNQGMGQFLGSAVGAAAAMYAGSDRRMKKHIKRLYRSKAGYDVYAFNYLWEPNGTTPWVGVMADELEKVRPDAVSFRPDGFKQVDYSKVVL